MCVDLDALLAVPLPAAARPATTGQSLDDSIVGIAGLVALHMA